MVKSKEYYWFESTYSVIAKKVKKGKKVVLIKMAKKFYVLSKIYFENDFYAKKYLYYCRLGSFSDILGIHGSKM